MSHDSELQQAVLAELNWEPSVTAANIGVTARAGVVALTGHVESYGEKFAADINSNNSSSAAKLTLA